jgi:hypothetical protein
MISSFVAKAAFSLQVKEEKWFLQLATVPSN